MIVKDIITHLEKDFPEDLAYEWDNVGLQVGKSTQEVDKLLVTLDVTLEVINEAIMIGAKMIIAHHPMIFHPILQVRTDELSGQMLECLLKNDITLYVMHTNYDISNKGMNKILADKLDLVDQEIIEFTTEDEGLGRIGHVEEMTLEAFGKKVKTAFDVSNIRVIGGLHQKITKVAVVGGSGSSVINAVTALGADVLVTGDITYHHALDMKMAGLLGIDPGHHIEVAFVDALSSELADSFEDLLVVKSKINTNPYQSL